MEDNFEFDESPMYMNPWNDPDSESDEGSYPDTPQHMNSSDDSDSMSGEWSYPDTPQHWTPNHSTSKSDNESDSCSPQVTASSGISTNVLPLDWKVEEKTQTYKVYTDPKTGMKFYSLRKVQAYLENLTPRQPPNKRGKRSMHMNPSNDSASKSGDESDFDSNQVTASSGNLTSGLPLDWKVEEKTKTYKVYTERKTGRKFYSLKKVQAYCGNPSPRQPPDKRRRVTYTDREETTVKGLPPQSNKVTRYRESRAGIHKKAAFSANTDAQRYIDSGTTKDCRMKPRRWSEISGNKFHSQPTDEETELKPEGRKRSLLSTKDSEPESKERTEKEPIFIEGNCKKNSEDAIETDDVPTEKTGTEEKGKDKMPERSSHKIRIKVPVSRASTSSIPLTSNPSSVCPVQSNLKSKTPESKQKKETTEVGRSQQVDPQAIGTEITKASTFSLPEEPSQDSFGSRF